MTTDTMLPLLRAYYAQVFPQHLNPRIDVLVSLNNGWESDVYAFRVEWGAGEDTHTDDLVLRIYSGADAVEKSAKEFRGLAMLKQAGYPVPRVDHLCQSDAPFGHPFLIMEAIPAVGNLWELMFYAAPEEQQRRLSQFCALFARLHAMDWRSYVPNPAEYEPGGPFGIVDRQVKQWQAIFEMIPLPGFRSNVDWMIAHQHDVPSPRASLAHWDFHPNNILLKADGEAVVIDWTGLDITDYRYDLAWTLNLLTSVEGDQWYEPILREYERQAGHQVEGMEIFYAAACFRRLYSVAVSIAYGAETLGMRPGAEAQMREHARPLRGVYQHLLAITGRGIPEIEQFLDANGA